MNFPAIAKQTYEKLRGQPAFSNITQFVIDHLKKISSATERARFVHHIVDDCNREVFAHPMVAKLSPCKVGCAGCCHTQVGITEDEAALLAERVEDGVKINYALLDQQIKMGNNPEDFYKLSYENRRCVFLGADDACLVYNDRPSVCRTNSVLGDASQCYPNTNGDESNSIRLLKTEQADMAIMGSFFMSKESGTLAFMMNKVLAASKPVENSNRSTASAIKKSIFKFLDL
jgi:Fe-S-cluster containining protein